MEIFTEAYWLADVVNPRWELVALALATWLAASCVAFALTARKDQNR